jgi:hypothetical protein
MKLENFHIRDHLIRCEIFESELNTHGKDPDSIALISFVLGQYSSEFLLAVSGHLWLRVARRYLILAKEVAQKAPGEVIGRISFDCDETHVEYEFSRLTKKSLVTLALIVQFIRHYPLSENIRIAREGPILVRFRYNTGSDGPEASAAEESGPGGWWATAGRSLKSIVRRKR